MKCLDENTVLLLMEERVSHAQQTRINEHVDGCTGCRELIAAFAASPFAEEDTATLVDATIPDSMEGLDGDSAPLEHGTMVDHFRIVRRLGRGGMGIVYLARDTQLDRNVALKVVQHELIGSDDAIARFFIESRATAKVSHPNIVSIHAVGEFRGRPYVALEHLKGATLAVHMQRLTVEEAVRIAVDIAEALVVAHEAGVWHRDLKPSNVHIDNHGHVRVLDFGLAKIVDAEPTPDPFSTRSKRSEEMRIAALTTTAIGGTPSYMAPEQWRHLPCSSATDVWALGVLLFEMCAKRSPFAQDEDGKLDHDDPLTARFVSVCGDNKATRLDTVASVELDLADLVADCLAKKAVNRPDAHEVLERLRGVQLRWVRESFTDLPVARVPGSTPPSSRPSRRSSAPSPPISLPSAQQSTAIAAPTPTFPWWWPAAVVLILLCVVAVVFAVGA